MKFFVYILQSGKDGSFYIGQTNNLIDRLKRHNAKSERYTKTRVPWKILWSVEVESRSQAMRLEKKLKNLKSTARSFRNKVQAIKSVQTFASGLPQKEVCHRSCISSVNYHFKN